MVLSLGNNAYRHSIREIMAGIVGIFVIVFFPAMFEFDWFIITTKPSDPSDESQAIVYRQVRVFSYIIGSMLLLSQVFNLIRCYVPHDKLTGNKYMTMFLRGSSVKYEFGTKQASIIKVHNMVKNAHDLHHMNKEDTNLVNRQHALHNYREETEVRESSGGFKWAWKLFISGKLTNEEGVW